MPVFKHPNVDAKLSETDKFQVGLSHIDPRGGQPVEQNVLIPFPSGKANWVYYDVALGCLLDSGIVVHRHLPQVDNTADTLASCDISDKNISAITGRGVNLVSNDRYADVVQRMAHSQYRFRLWGEAMRAGEQIPIPGLKKVGGQLAIPHDENPQWAYNKIVGNYSGVILWYAQWSLWYTLAAPPTVQQVPPQNPFQDITGDSPLPKGIQAPWSQPDDLAQDSGPTLQLQNPIAR